MEPLDPRDISDENDIIEEGFEEDTTLSGVSEETGNKSVMSAIRDEVSFSRVAILAIATGIGASAVNCMRATIERGTDFEILEETGVGRNNIRVTHHFEIWDSVNHAVQTAQSDVYSKGGWLRFTDPVRIESIDDSFLGEHKLVFTGEVISNDQYAKEEEARFEEREKKRKEEAPPAKICDQGNGVYSFDITRRYYADLVLMKTVAVFKQQHPGVTFDLLKAPNTCREEGGCDRYLIFTKPKTECEVKAEK